MKIKLGQLSTFFIEEKVASGKPAVLEYRREPKKRRHIGKVFWLDDDIHGILVVLAWSQELIEKPQSTKAKSWGEVERKTVTQLSEAVFSIVSDIAFTIYTDNGKEPVIKADVRTLQGEGSWMQYLTPQISDQLWSVHIKEPAGKDRKQRYHLGICQWNFQDS